MAVSNPSAKYKWALPLVGGSIGGWGGILNTIFGNELTPTELTAHATTPAVPPPGIDQVIDLIQTDLDTAEATLVSQNLSITSLQDGGAAPFYARTSMSAAQSISKGIPATKVTWGSVDFDQGSVLVDPTLMTIPVGADGAWLFRASIQMAKTVGSGDDGRQIVISIRKNGIVVAQASSPYVNDGIDSTNSGDVTLSVAFLDGGAINPETYDVTVFQTFFDGGVASGDVLADTGSFFEAIRFAPAVTP